jgi:hypothetical protein
MAMSFCFFRPDLVFTQVTYHSVSACLSRRTPDLPKLAYPLTDKSEAAKSLPRTCGSVFETLL